MLGGTVMKLKIWLWTTNAQICEGDGWYRVMLKNTKFPLEFLNKFTSNRCNVTDFQERKNETFHVQFSAKISTQSMSSLFWESGV